MGAETFALRTQMAASTVMRSSINSGRLRGRNAPRSRKAGAGRTPGSDPMPYAAIMVNVEDDEASSGRIKLAAHLSVRLRCALIGVAARMPRPASLSDGDVVGGEAQYPIDAIDNWLGQQENSFREIASPIQQKIEWRSATDFPVDFVATQARAADLVVIAHRHVRDDSYHSLNPGAVSGVRDDLAVSPPSFP